MSDEIQARVEDLETDLIRDRRNFHQFPEAGWTEFRTAAAIAARLKDLGYDIKLGEASVDRRHMMGVPAADVLQNHMQRAVTQGADPSLVEAMAGGLTGVVAELHCEEGPTVALRFDIDANDIQEALDDKHRPFREGFASKNPGVMHACGHDGHAAMGLAVARVLADMRDTLKGSVRLIFEPGEEGSRGAAPMAAAGAVDGVNFIIGGHIGFQAREKGQLICSTGKFLATTKFDVSFSGKPAHAGAAPQEGKNALLAAACATLNLHAIARHGDGASRVTVGTFHAGQGRNVIPPNAVLQMETRGETSGIDADMYAQAQQIVQGAGTMYDVAWDIQVVGGTKSGESSPEMMRRLKRVAQGIGYFQPDKIVDYCTFGATEDFSHFMTLVQENGGIGTYFMIGTELAAGHHNFYFDFDESTLAPGVELLAKTVVDLIG